MFLVLVTCPCPMPFPLLQALLLLPLLPLLAVSQISVRLLLCSFLLQRCHRVRAVPPSRLNGLKEIGRVAFLRAA